MKDTGTTNAVEIKLLYVINHVKFILIVISLKSTSLYKFSNDVYSVSYQKLKFS